MSPVSRDTFRSHREPHARIISATCEYSGMSKTQNQLQEELDQIEAKLSSGVTSVTVDGTTTQINHEYLRKRANDLRKRITAENTRRPAASSIYLGGF